ncbi:substrate-binding domain-containing protein [Izhakiella australiensis]|nr:substrate-binding domain-containing protein [Izhakiella australiensis]
MKKQLSERRFKYALTLVLMLFSSLSAARETTLTVFCSGGLMGVLQQLAPAWQQRSGVRLQIESAPSMGSTPQSIPQRLAHHQQADVLVMVDDGIKPLVEHKWVSLNNRVPLANSYVALAIPAGKKKPDISTPDKLKAVLLKAHHVAYSDSASGRYVSESLYKKLGIERQMAAKSEMIPATPVGKIVASGKADVGFQQLSELQVVKGITVVGLIPDSLQKTTLYSAIPLDNSAHPSQARDFIHYLSSAHVASIIRQKGMSPLNQQTN